MTTSPFASANAPLARFCAAAFPFIFSTTRFAWFQSAPAWPYEIFISAAHRTKNACASLSPGAEPRSCAAEPSASRAEEKVPRESFGCAAAMTAAVAGLALRPVLGRSLFLQNIPSGVLPARNPSTTMPPSAATASRKAMLRARKTFEGALAGRAFLFRFLSAFFGCAEAGAMTGGGAPRAGLDAGLGCSSTKSSTDIARLA